MTTSTIRFRDATLRDTAMLAELGYDTFFETFGHLYAAEDLRAHLNAQCSEDFFHAALTSGDHIILAEDNGHAVGYCKIGRIGMPVAYPPAEAQEIHRIYVRKAYQGQGLGQELLERALQTKRLREAPVVYLGVWEENLPAQQLYYRHGFMPVGRYLYNVGKHVDREIILAHAPAMAQEVPA